MIIADDNKSGINMMIKNAIINLVLSFIEKSSEPQYSTKKGASHESAYKFL